MNLILFLITWIVTGTIAMRLIYHVTTRTIAYENVVDGGDYERYLKEVENDIDEEADKMPIWDMIKTTVFLIATWPISVPCLLYRIYSIKNEIAEDYKRFKED